MDQLDSLGVGPGRALRATSRMLNRVEFDRRVGREITEEHLRPEGFMVSVQIPPGAA